MNTKHSFNYDSLDNCYPIKGIHIPKVANISETTSVVFVLISFQLKIIDFWESQI